MSRQGGSEVFHNYISRSISAQNGRQRTEQKEQNKETENRQRTDLTNEQALSFATENLNLPLGDQVEEQRTALKHAMDKVTKPNNEST